MKQKILNIINKNRFKLYGSYKFDRIIFKLAMYFSLGYLFFVAWSYNFNLDYFSCPQYSDGSIKASSKIMLGDQSRTSKEGFCKNPFYTPQTWKNEEYLLPGEYGQKPGALFNSINYIPFVILGLAFLINHIIYNRGVKFEININN